MLINRIIISETSISPNYTDFKERADIPTALFIIYGVLFDCAKDCISTKL